MFLEKWLHYAQGKIASKKQMSVAKKYLEMTLSLILKSRHVLVKYKIINTGKIHNLAWNCLKDKINATYFDSSRFICEKDLIKLALKKSPQHQTFVHIDR